MILDSERINQIVVGQAREFLVQRPDLAPAIRSLMFSFNTRFSSIQIKEVSDIFDLCREIDEKLDIDPEIGTAILDTRKNIQELLTHALFDSKRRSAYGDTEELRELSRQEDLAKKVAKLVCLVRKDHKEGGFTQNWIREIDPTLFEELKLLVTDRITRVQKWEEVKVMLPTDLKDAFDITRVMSKEKTLLAHVEPYKELAKKLGPEAIAEFLVSIGAVREQEFSRIIGILSEYLGPVRVPKPSLDDVSSIPEGMLKLPSLKRWLFIRLRNYVYRELLKGGHDSGIATAHKGELERVKARVRKIAETKLSANGYQEHRELLNAVVAYFEEALSLKVPDRMVGSLQDKQGDTHFVPSLRQRLAMLEIRGTGVSTYGMEEEDSKKSSNRRILIEFFMGRGKTLAAFLGKEFVGAKKMLYCCPNVGGGKLVDEIKARIESKYYKEGKQPTVGVIRAGMNGAELTAALDCEVVIFPYSMFGSDVDEKRIVDEVKSRNFDYMVVDEIQYARKDYGRNTQVVFELATGIPDLYDKGYIVGLTGNSTPNRPDDIVPQLKLWDKDAFGEVASVRAAVRRSGPVALRNAVSDFVLLVDEPEDWEKYVKTEFVDLYPEEREIYAAILGDENLEPTTKLRMLYLCAMNPTLFAPTADITSAFFDTLAKKVDDAISSHGKVVVAENAFKHGLFRDMNNTSGRTLVSKLQQHVGSRAEVCMIDGDTPESERRRIFEDSKDPDRKMVIVAMGDIIRVGIDLSHISRCICMNPCWNKPDLAQLVKRFAREGNEDAKVTVLVPRDTVLQGILEHSEEKAVETDIFKHGGALTEDDLALLERGDFTDEVVVARSRVYIGTIIRNSTLTDKQKLHRMFDYMAGLGEEGLRLFVDQYGEEFAKLYIRVWERGYGGNNGRFVAGLWEILEDGGVIKGNRIADLGCGHLALQNTFAAMGDNKDRTIFNLDLNGYMLEGGRALLRTRDPKAKPIMHNGSFTDMQAVYPDKNFDAINSSMTLYCTNLSNKTKDLHKDERVRTLLEFNRVLKDGGVMVLTLPIDSCHENEFDTFVEQLERHFGFEVLRDYTGKAVSTDATKDAVSNFENHVVVCRKVKEPEINGLTLSNLKFTRVKDQVKPKGRRRMMVPCIRDEDKGFIHTTFRINKNDFGFDFGIADKKMEEERFREKVVGARECFRRLYEKNGKSLMVFTEEDKGEIILNGITPIGTGTDNPCFILADDPCYPKRLWYLYE